MTRTLLRILLPAAGVAAVLAFVFIPGPPTDLTRVLMLVVCLPPLVAWALVAEWTAVSIVSGVAITALTVLAAAAFTDRLNPPVTNEELVIFVPVLGVVACGLTAFVGRPSEAIVTRGRVVAHATAVIVLAPAVLCGGPGFEILINDSETGAPRGSSVLPLPDGLRLVSQEVGSHGNGGYGYRSLVVTATDGASTSAVVDRLRRHAMAQGWTEQYSRLQKTVGVLLREEYCVNVTDKPADGGLVPGEVKISLSASCG